jgi:hypothetical protein
MRPALRSHQIIFPCQSVNTHHIGKMFRMTSVLCLVQIFVGCMGLNEITKLDLSFV